MGHFIFTKKAETDLIEIYRYSFLNYGERQADFYIEALKQKCRFLADNPLLYRERDEFTTPVRIHHHKKHLIVYTLERDHIVIIRLLHERMDVGQKLEH
jgi:toxin ParE1/3/4